MFSQEAAFTITADHISQYAAHLQEQERAKNTVKKYVHDLNDFMLFLNGKAVTKVAVIAWKEHLADTYTPATVNSSKNRKVEHRWCASQFLVNLTEQRKCLHQIGL